MALIVAATLRAGRAEWLAGARASPNRSVVGNPGESQGVAPASDTGEEVALTVGSQIVGSYIENAPFVNIAGCNQTATDQLAQPRSGVRIVFVVVGGHAAAIARLAAIIATTLRSAHSHAASAVARSVCSANSSMTATPAFAAWYSGPLNATRPVRW